MFRSFEIIILSFRSEYNSFVAACVYRPPGSCTTQFLEDFLALSGFLSSIGSNFIICGDKNVHLDVECGDRTRFYDILQCCSLIQCVNSPTHILGHTLDVLISPGDSDFVRNVNVGDFISDHAAIRCQLDFSHPAICIVKMVSYRRYHRIDINHFRKALEIFHLYSLLQEPRLNCMISTGLTLPRYLISTLLSSHTWQNGSQMSGCLSHIVWLAP